MQCGAASPRNTSSPTHLLLFNKKNETEMRKFLMQVFTSFTSSLLTHRTDENVQTDTYAQVTTTILCEYIYIYIIVTEDSFNL